jgi:hypothetical protein
MGNRWAGGWRWALVAVISTAVLVVLGIIQWKRGFSGTATAAQILALVPLAAPVVRWGRGDRASRDAVRQRSVMPSAWDAVPVADEVLRDLHAAVTRYLPGPEETWPARFGLPAHWLAAGQDLAGEWADQARPGDQEAGLLRSVAGGSGIVAEYLQLPAKRLVILGGEGAGKTTLATRLVLDWHKFPALSGRVPVPVRIDAWNPARRSFNEWFCEQLVSCYAQDAARSREIAASAQLIPVLDGFDELAPDLRRVALERLTGTGRPLVLVSRTDEYRAAVQACGRPLQAAAGIVLQDLSLTEDAVAAYLHQGSARWDELLARLNASPVDQQVVNLNSVLSTPMLIRLARERYQQQGSNPCSLLDEDRFATREDIEDHFYQGFVTAAYQYEGGPGDRPWQAGTAEPWLGFLARRARGRASQICWWQIEAATPVQGWAAFLFGAAAFGLVFGLAPVLLFGRWLSGGAAVAVGVVGGILGLSIGVSAGQTLPAPGMRRLRRLLNRWLAGVIFGFMGGFATAATVLLVTNPHPAAAREAFFGSVFGKMLFFFPLLAGWVMAGDFHIWSKGRIDMPVISSPVGLLNADRAAAIGESILLAVVLGGSIGTLAALMDSGIPDSMSISQSFFRGVLLGVLYAVAYALAARAWSRWNLFGRIPLALFRLQPWRMIRFLEDARGRGILRHAGLAYEFRTEGLHRYLVTVQKERSGSGMLSITEWLFDIPPGSPFARSDAPTGFDNSM